MFSFKFVTKILYLLSKKLRKEIIMKTGSVKWFNPSKGYGFIAPDDGSKDIFVHISALETSGIKSLSENQKVTYDEARNKDRISAGNIKLVD